VARTGGDHADALTTGSSWPTARPACGCSANTANSSPTGTRGSRAAALVPPPADATFEVMVGDAWLLLMTGRGAALLRPRGP
jgi:hypothetical protein